MWVSGASISALAALLNRSPQSAQVGAINDASRPYDSNAFTFAEIRAFPAVWPPGIRLTLKERRFMAGR